MQKTDGQTKKHEQHNEYIHRLLAILSRPAADEIQGIRRPQPLSQPDLQVPLRFSATQTKAKQTSRNCHFGLQCIGSQQGTTRHKAKHFVCVKHASTGTQDTVPVCATANWVVKIIGFKEYGAIIALLQLSQKEHRLAIGVPCDDLRALRKKCDEMPSPTRALFQREKLEELCLRRASRGADGAVEEAGLVEEAPVAYAPAVQASLVALLELNEEAHRLVTGIPFDHLRALAEFKQKRQQAVGKLHWLAKCLPKETKIDRVTQIYTVEETKLIKQPELEMANLGDTKSVRQPLQQLGKRTCASHLCHFKWQCLGCRERTKDHVGTFCLRVPGEPDGTGQVIRLCKTAQLVVNTFGYDEYVAKIAEKGKSRQHPPSLSSTPPHKKTKTVQTK